MATLLEKPTEISKDHYLLRFTLDSKESLPGQFINIKVTDSTDPLLRRPFSIYNHDGDTIEIIIKVIGIGTKILSTYKPGPIDILGPLGKGFTLVENQNVILIGGGVGNAPLYYLAKELKRLNNTIHFIYGARSEPYMYEIEKFKEMSDNMVIATDDGSAGKKGTVIDVLHDIIDSEEFSYIYTCGPTVMMEAVVKESKKIPVEVSLENYFGCGIGLCVGCTVETDSGLRRACVNGPVFDGHRLTWNNIA